MIISLLFVISMKPHKKHYWKYEKMIAYWYGLLSTNMICYYGGFLSYGGYPQIIQITVDHFRIQPWFWESPFQEPPDCYW